MAMVAPAAFKDGGISNNSSAESESSLDVSIVVDAKQQQDRPSTAGDGDNNSNADPTTTTATTTTSVSHDAGLDNDEDDQDNQVNLLASATEEKVKEPDTSEDAAAAAAVPSSSSSSGDFTNTSSHSHNQRHGSSSGLSVSSANLIAPKRPQRFQPPKHTASNGINNSGSATPRSSSTAFRTLRKNKSERRLQVEKSTMHHNQSGHSVPSSPVRRTVSQDHNTSKNEVSSSKSSSPDTGIGTSSLSMLTGTNSSDDQQKQQQLQESKAGFFPHDSISSIRMIGSAMTDPNFLDLSLGDHLGDTNTTDNKNTNEEGGGEQQEVGDKSTNLLSGSSPLAAHGSERSLNSQTSGRSRNSSRHPVDPNRPKFKPPPPRKSKYQIAEEATIAAAEAERRGGWRTFTRNLSFINSSVSNFVGDRTSTFSKNVSIVGDLLKNQRELAGGLDDIVEEEKTYYISN